MKQSICSFILIVFAVHAFTQSTKDEVLKAKATGYSTDYPNATAVFLNNQINIVFGDASGKTIVDGENGISQVKEKHESEVLSLRGNPTGFSEEVFTNTLISTSGFSVSGSRYFESKDYNYFGAGIFYNDSKLKVYSFMLNYFAEKVKFDYTVKFNDIKYFTSIYFSQNYPVVDETITIEIPSWIDIELVEMNFEGYDISKNVKTGLNSETIYTYTTHNLPPMANDDHAPQAAAVYPHIYFVPKSYTDKNTKVELLGNLNSLYAWYRKLVLTIENDRDVISKLVQELVADKQTNQEKICTLFYWVQDNIRYIAYENGIMGFKPEAAQTVLKNRYGDCKGQANLLREMLLAAGFDARLVWLGTKGIPYSYEKPSLLVDNHMICCVFLNNERIFLDPTETNIAMNDYADRIQGRQVLIENGDQYILDSIVSFSFDRNLETTELTLNLDLLTNVLNGNQKLVINGESKTGFLSSYEELRTDDKEDALNAYLRNGNKNVSVSNVIMSDLNKREQPIEINSDISFRNQVTAFENELYVSLENDFALSALKFDSTRKSDYIFNHKYNLRSIIEFSIPEGYTVDYLPDDFTADVDEFHFNLKMRQVEKKIVYTKDIHFSSTWLRMSFFEQWNKAIISLNKFYKEQIVLKKI